MIGRVQLSEILFDSDVQTGNVTFFRWTDDVEVLGDGSGVAIRLETSDCLTPLS